MVAGAEDEKEVKGPPTGVKGLRVDEDEEVELAFKLRLRGLVLFVIEVTLGPGLL